MTDETGEESNDTTMYCARMNVSSLYITRILLRWYKKNTTMSNIVMTKLKKMYINWPQFQRQPAWGKPNSAQFYSTTTTWLDCMGETVSSNPFFLEETS